MSGSFRLDHLEERIRSLSSTFLPPRKPTGNYSQEEFDRTAAFLLMAHAEIEDFIENRCLEVANAVVSNWSVDSKPRSTLISLAAFSHSKGEKALPEADEQHRSSIRDVIDEAKRSYSAVVNRNHGVQPHNLLSLLIPIGIREADIPNQLMIDLNNFGSKRGELAHNSNVIQNAPDPEIHRILVEDIVSELSGLNSHLTRLECEDPAMAPS